MILLPLIFQDECETRARALFLWFHRDDRDEMTSHCRKVLRVPLIIRMTQEEMVASRAAWEEAEASLKGRSETPVILLR